MATIQRQRAACTDTENRRRAKPLAARGTVCRPLSHGETEHNRVAVSANGCEALPRTHSDQVLPHQRHESGVGLGICRRHQPCGPAPPPRPRRSVTVQPAASQMARPAAK